jgi:Zn-dependent oligopeptidase
LVLVAKPSNGKLVLRTGIGIVQKHYETGEVIPQEYVEKIKRKCEFLRRMATLRQISFDY